MFSTSSSSGYNGFTFVELMIVIAILMILFMVVSVPYGYYAERARVRDGANRIEQLWSLAHTAVKNGIVLSGGVQNANIAIVFEKDAKTVNLYSVPLKGSITTLSSPTLPSDIILKNQVKLDPLKILSITGGTSNLEHTVYFIQAPYGTGKFLGSDISNITVTIGYPNASLESGRSKSIKLEKW